MSAVETYANIRKSLEIELQDFVTLYTGSQVVVISALADKITHMCNYIGSPSSVLPMLQSIVNGKVKKWGSDNCGYKGVEQLTGMHITQIDRKYENVKTGHFRWNFKAYKVDRETRDYIRRFYFENDIVNLRKESKAHKGGLRMGVKHLKTSNHSNNLFIVNITTPQNNDYRYFYYRDTETVQTNCNVHEPINKHEEAWVKNLALAQMPATILIKI